MTEESNEGPTPRQRAFDAIDDFETAVTAADDYSPPQRMKAEADAFEELTEELGECYADGLTQIPVGQFADTVAQMSNTLTKTEAKQQIVSKSQRAKANGDGRERLDEWVQANLQQVSVVSTTDHIDDTKYRWDFGTCTVETSGGSDGRGHYDWVNFRDSIDEAGGPYLSDPNDPLTDTVEWRRWIVDVREEHERVKTTVGLRTSAVEYLQNRVRRSDGHGSLADAVNWSGVYVELNEDKPDDAEPVDTDESPQELPDWRVETIYIDNEWPKEAAEEFGITTRALQNEIDARGYMLDGHSRIATQEYVGGEYVTFWVVTGEFATPAAYQPEGEASAQSGVDALESDDDSTDESDFGSIGGE